MLMFSHIYVKLIIHCFSLVVHMYPVWWGLHDTLVPLDSTYASPGPPKMKTKFWENVHQITSIFYILLSFVGPCSIYIYIKCLWVLLTNVQWFRATGGYICGCGRPSNLVILIDRLIHCWWLYTILFIACDRLIYMFIACDRSTEWF